MFEIVQAEYLKENNSGWKLEVHYLKDIFPFLVIDRLNYINLILSIWKERFIIGNFPLKVYVFQHCRLNFLGSLMALFMLLGSYNLLYYICHTICRGFR